MFQCNKIALHYREHSNPIINQNQSATNNKFEITIGTKARKTIGNFINLGSKPSTPWSSRAVPQPSTDLALHRFAVEFRWDPACSMQYGRRLNKVRDYIREDVYYRELPYPIKKVQVKLSQLMTPYIFCIYVEALEVNSFQVFPTRQLLQVVKMAVELVKAQ